jgi:hypothetical protein
VSTDKHNLEREANGTLSFIAAAARYQADGSGGLPKHRIVRLFRDYFRDSPEWKTNISIRLTPVRQGCNASGHR